LLQSETAQSGEIDVEFDVCWMLNVQASLKSDATALQLSGPLYTLHLSSASGILARAATNVFISHGM